MKKLLFISPYSLTLEQKEFLERKYGKGIEISQINLTIKTWHRLKYYNFLSWDTVLLDIPKDDLRYTNIYGVFYSILPFKKASIPKGWENRSIYPLDSHIAYPLSKLENYLAEKYLK